MSTICETNPELWWSNDAQDFDDAKEACGFCPQQADCLAGALERGEASGIWGGVDLSGRFSGPRPRQPRVPMDAVKPCEMCGGAMRPHRDERMGAWNARRFCSRKCANNRPRRPRKAAA